MAHAPVILANVFFPMASTPILSWTGRRVEIVLISNLSEIPARCRQSLRDCLVIKKNRRSEKSKFGFRTDRQTKPPPFSGHETKNRKIEVFFIREIVVETVLVFFVLELVPSPPQNNNNNNTTKHTTEKHTPPCLLQHGNSVPLTEL
jgi:hypothetical protein